MDKVEIYLDEKGEYRWRYKARNGRILADSGEGYKQKRNALEALRHVRAFQVPEIVDLTKEK